MRSLPFILAFIGAIVLAIVGTTPPFALGKNAEESVFSAGRAMDHVRVIAAEPHVTGSRANTAVRTYISLQFEALGMDVVTTTGQVPEAGLEKFGHWSGTRPDALTFTNIIATLPGRDRTKPALMLMAHHDTVWNSPGAPDDTAGVAAIIETLRAITATGPLERDVVAFITDAEELGLVGARQFFSRNALRERIGAIINLEARGGGGRTTLFQTSADNGNAVRLYAESVGRPGGSSLATFVYETLPNDTDLTPALELDVVAYNLSFIGRPGLYHSPLATPENLDRGSLQDMGAQTLALTRALGEAEELPGPAPSRTFFDVFGLFTVQYGAVLGWVLLGVAAALNVLALRGANGSALRSVGAALAVIAGGGGLLFVLNLVSGAGTSNEYYDRLAAIPMLEAQAFLACAAVLAATAPLWAGRAGSIVGLAIALAAQIIAPVTAFIVVFPLLVGGLAAVAAQYLPSPAGNVAKVLGAAIVGGFLLQFGHFLMQGVGPDMPWLAALLAALAMPILGLLLPVANRKAAFTIAFACLLGATAIALFVRFDPVAETVADYESLKG